MSISSIFQGCKNEHTIQLSLVFMLIGKYSALNYIPILGKSILIPCAQVVIFDGVGGEGWRECKDSGEGGMPLHKRGSGTSVLPMLEWSFLTRW